MTTLARAANASTFAPPASASHRAAESVPTAARAVLLLGDYRPTLTLARELAPLGYRVIVARGLGEGCSEYSRFVAETWDHPPLARPDAFLAALTGYLESRPDIAVVYPIFEDYVRLLAQAHDRLPPGRIYPTPRPETVLASLDKTRMARLAESVGVPIARNEIVDGRAALMGALERVGFPLVIRPQESGEGVAGRKALICRDRADVARHLPAWPAGHDKLMVQRYIAGPRFNHYFAAQGGRLCRLLETRISETETLDGTGLAVSGETVPVSPDLRDYTERLARALDYTGIGLVQYMVDRCSGEVTFVELNPRIVGSHVIAEAMGLELGPLAIDLAERPGRPVALRIGAAGSRYAWSYGAIRGLVAAVRSGELGRAEGARSLLRVLGAGLRAGTHMTWRRDDPLPTVMLFLQLLRPSLRSRRPASGPPQPSSLLGGLT